MYKSKFKVGNKVRVVTNSTGFTNVSKGDVMVLDFFDKDGDPKYKNLSDSRLVRSVVMWDWELEFLTIPDTKIGRRLHKNNIDRIEDGKIFLKG